MTAAVAALLLGAGCVPVAAPGQGCQAAASPVMSMPQIRGVPFQMTQAVRQMQGQANAAQARQAAECAQAERQARMPRIASASYTGELTPIDDARRLFCGQSLTLEAPVRQMGTVIRTERVVMYLAADGNSYSETWTNRPWSGDGGALCLGAGATQSCRPAYRDSVGQVFLKDERNVYLHVSEIARGDTHQVRQAYAQYMRNQRQAQARRDEAVGLLAGFLVSAMMSSGSGGGGSPSRGRNDPNDVYLVTRPGSASSAPAPSAPPISSFYGSCHNPMGC